MLLGAAVRLQAREDTAAAAEGMANLLGQVAVAVRGVTPEVGTDLVAPEALVALVDLVARATAALEAAPGRIMVQDEDEARAFPRRVAVAHHQAAIPVEVGMELLASGQKERTGVGLTLLCWRF